jgi:hypothetical protein
MLDAATADLGLSPEERADLEGTMRARLAASSDGRTR